MLKTRLLLSYSMLALSRLNRSLLCHISSSYMRLKLWLSGATIGKNSKFFGNTYLSIHPKSTLSIGEQCVFRSSFSSNTIGLKQKCFISTQKGASLSIGNNCGFSGTVIAAQENISIGNQVLCGANVTIADSDRHPLDHELRAQGHGGEAESVIIEDDVWVGMNTIILKGVKIGEKTIIAANSLVNKDLPPNVLAGGIPAKIIRNL